MKKGVVCVGVYVHICVAVKVQPQDTIAYETQSAVYFEARSLIGLKLITRLGCQARPARLGIRLSLPPQCLGLRGHRVALHLSFYVCYGGANSGPPAYKGSILMAMLPPTQHCLRLLSSPCYHGQYL